jgi:enterochelin esterase family protein
MATAEPGTVVVETITSEVLQGNALGDPAERRVPVYLPPGYADSDRRYPVAYMLTGFTGRGTMLLNDSLFDENLPERLDRLIGSGEMEPIIVVMPDCATRLGGSQYLNSSATGRYEDHLIGELVPFIDGRCRTRAEAGQRAVLGKSSGGYGSLVMAMRHPDVFGLMACHSGDMYFEYCYKPDLIAYARAVGGYGGLDGFLRDLRTIRPRNKDFWSSLNTVAMASCYSPNPAAPQGFDVPIDPETGELIEDVWARWLEWDPVHMLAHEAYAGALRNLRLCYLDCGRKDEFNLHLGARIFTRRLRELGIAHVYEEFDDGHMNIPYRYDVALRAISAVLAGEAMG